MGWAVRGRSARGGSDEREACACLRLRLPASHNRPHAAMLPTISDCSSGAGSSDAPLIDAMELQSPEQHSSPINGPKTSASASLDTSQLNCRYCLGTGHSLNYSDDPESLIGPCHCKGSMAMVHPRCLLRWLQLSRQHRCELCGFDLRQCERLGQLPETGSQSQRSASPQSPSVASQSPVSAPPLTVGDWLRQYDQACWLCMTICCLMFATPLVSVLLFFVVELRAAAAAKKQPDDEAASEEQLLLFELLAGFAVAGFLLWLLYICGSMLGRCRRWRRQVRRFTAYQQQQRRGDSATDAAPLP